MLRLVYFPFVLAAGLAFATMAALAQDRALVAPDDSTISISGKVAAIEEDAFTLDYGAGRIRVDLDDGWEWFPPGTPHLTIGEMVTVNGMIDDDMFNSREIEATSIYRATTRTFLYSDATNARFLPPIVEVRPDERSWVNLAGTVTGISGREFILDTGLREIRIDTDNMDYDPVTASRIRPGTRVSVTARVDDEDIFERREIDAEAVMVLSQPRRVIITR